jgi:hypothetical protein
VLPALPQPDPKPDARFSLKAASLLNVGVCVAILWCFITLYRGAAPRIDSLRFFDGVVALVYCSLFLAARTRGGSRAYVALALAAAVWVYFSVGILVVAGYYPAKPEIAGNLAFIAPPLAIGVGVALRSWGAFGLIAGCVIGSAVFGFALAPGFGWFGVAAGSAAIHAGLALVVHSHVRRQLLLTQPGCCSSCGYQLEGNRSDVCPECGKGLPSPSADPRPAQGSSADDKLMC